MATLTLTVSGTSYTLPDPQIDGMSVSHNKIWSENSGRTSAGTFVGTIIAVKRKVELSWPILSKSDAALLRTASSSTTATVTLSYPDVNGTVSLTAYLNDFTYTVADFGRWWVKDAKLNIIEV